MACVNGLQNGSTALVRASSKGVRHMFKCLLEHKADIGSALFRASCGGHAAVAAVLIAHRADVDQKHASASAVRSVS